jgi:hypothetical protein
MTREQLIEKGVDSRFINSVILGIDEVANSPFDSVEDFLFEYLFYDDVGYEYQRKDVRYYIVGGNDKTIQVLVWLQKESV